MESIGPMEESRYASATDTKPPRQAIEATVGRTDEMIDAMNSANQVLGGLLERLFGPMPQEVATAPADARAPGSQVGLLEDRQRVLASAVSTNIDLARRLASRL